MEVRVVDITRRKEADVPAVRQLVQHLLRVRITIIDVCDREMRFLKIYLEDDLLFYGYRRSLDSLFHRKQSASESLRWRSVVDEFAYRRYEPPSVALEHRSAEEPRLTAVVSLIASA